MNEKLTEMILASTLERENARLREVKSCFVLSDSCPRRSRTRQGADMITWRKKDPTGPDDDDDDDEEIA